MSHKAPILRKSDKTASQSSMRGTECEGKCGRVIPVHSGQRRCQACRAKKSRAKRGAIPQAYSMGFQIDAWGKLLSEGTLDHEAGRELVNAVWDRIYELHEQVKRLEAVAAHKAEEAEKKKRR